MAVIMEIQYTWEYIGGSPPPHPLAGPGETSQRQWYLRFKSPLFCLWDFHSSVPYAQNSLSSIFSWLSPTYSSYLHACGTSSERLFWISTLGFTSYQYTSLVIRIYINTEQEEHIPFSLFYPQYLAQFLTHSNSQSLSVEWRKRWSVYRKSHTLLRLGTQRKRYINWGCDRRQVLPSEAWSSKAECVGLNSEMMWALPSWLRQTAILCRKVGRK